jgi:hypothetical protein
MPPRLWDIIGSPTQQNPVEAEANLMLKASSLFSQILAEIPRTDFEKQGEKHGTERHAKDFRSWNQFVAMLFCHLARAHLVARDMPVYCKLKTGGSMLMLSPRTWG